MGSRKEAETVKCEEVICSITIVRDRRGKVLRRFGILSVAARLDSDVKRKEPKEQD